MKEHRYLAWKNLEKKYCPGHAVAALSDLREVIGEFFLFDDEKPSLFVSISQRLWKRCINKLILGRVVPTISESSSWEILSSIRMLRGSFLPRVRASCSSVLPRRCSLSTVTRLAMTCCWSAMRTAR